MMYILMVYLQIPGVSGVNFTSATHVYTQYTTSIFEDSTFAIKLSYITGGGTLSVVSPNA